MADGEGFDVQLSYTYADALSNQTFGVQVTDVGGAQTGASTSTFSVADVPLTNATGVPVSATEGASTGLVTVATFVDPGNPSNTLQADYSAAITWGDGNSSPGSFVYDTVNNVWDVQGSNTYAEAGSYPVTVNIVDGGCATRSSSTATVTAGPQNVTGVALSATEGASTGPVTVATFSDPGNPSNTLLASYSATITWGDGSTSPGSFVYDAINNVWDVQGSNTYAEEGSYNVSVTVNDGPSNSATASSTAAVADVPLTNVIGGSVTVLMGSWNLDGNANDSSGNGNDGVIYGNPNWIPGGGMHFDGVTNYIEIPNTSNWNFPSGFTIEASIRYTDLRPWDSCIVAKHIAGQHAGYGLGIQGPQAPGFPPNEVFFFAQPGNAPDYRIFGGTQPDGQWHDLKAVYDGNSLALYVSDASTNWSWQLRAEQDSWTYNAFNSVDVRIGDLVEVPGEHSVPFSGDIRNVQIYAGVAPSSTRAPVTATEGTSTGLVTVATFTDAGNPSNTLQADYSASIDWGDGNTSLGSFVYDTVNNVWDVQGSNTYGEAGSFPISVTINDGPNNSATASSTATVADAALTNVTGVPVAATEASSTGTVTVATFTDGGNPSNTLQADYSASIDWGDGNTSPGSFVYDTIDNVWDVQGSDTYAEAGSYHVSVTINDGPNNSTTASSTATVSDVPLTNVTGVPVSATEGSSTGTVTVATFTDAGNPSNTMQADYSATIKWGDGNTRPGSFVYDTLNNVWDVQGSNNYAETGSYPISVTINDGPTFSTIASSTATVADVPLTNVTGVPVAATEAAFSGTVTVATFVDPGNPSNTLQADYSAAITWGDGNSSPGSFVYDTVNNVWDVQGSNNYAEEGSYPISVTINDGSSNSATASSTATVADVPLTNVFAGGWEVYPGETVTSWVATFTDAGNPSNALQADYSASIDWGDGSAPSPGSFVYDYEGLENVWFVFGAHTYTDAGASGVYTQTVTINDGAQTVTRSQPTIVLPSYITGVPVYAMAEVPTGTVTVATFTDGNPPNSPVPSDYSASITWGDGNSSPGSFTYDAVNNVWDVQGSNTYAAPGNYPVAVTLIDGFSSVSSSSTATVSAGLESVTGVAVSATEGASTGPVKVATFTDPGNPSNTLLAAYSATITWGDGNSSPGSFVYDTVHNVWDVQGSNTYAEAGSYTLAVTINDGPTNSASAASTATVADVPLGNVTGVPVTATEGAPTGTLTVATFADAGNPSNTLQADYSATITWGDGNSSLGSFVYDTIDNVWDVQGSHTYVAAGSFNVSVTINDGPTNSTTASSTATVAAATTTTVSTSHASVVYGTTVTFTAVVTASTGKTAPTKGTVDFKDTSSGTDFGDGTWVSSSGTKSTWTFTTTAGTWVTPIGIGSSTPVKTFNVTSGDTITATYTSGQGFLTSSGTVTQAVTKGTLTITAKSYSRTYDGYADVPTGVTPTVTGLVTGDTLTSAPSETYNTKDVGSKTLSVTPGSFSINDGNGGNNYTVKLVNVSGQIRALPITVTAATWTKPYDGTTSAAVPSPGATPTITLPSYATPNAYGVVGATDKPAFTETYNSSSLGTGLTLTPTGSVSDGNGGHNYAVTFVKNTTGAITTVVPGVITDASPGFKETLGTWSHWLTEGNWTYPGYLGDDLEAESAQGTASATWTYTNNGSATDDYTVYVTWPACANRATNVPYTVSVYNSSGILQGTTTTFYVSQQIPLTTNGQANGTPNPKQPNAVTLPNTGPTGTTAWTWLPLGGAGAYAVPAGGTLVVGVSNNGTGKATRTANQVEADAVYIVDPPVPGAAKQRQALRSRRAARAARLPLPRRRTRCSPRRPKRRVEQRRARLPGPSRTRGGCCMERSRRPTGPNPRK